MLVSLILLFHGFLSIAQEYQQLHHFQYLNIEEGLSHRYVFDIAQDHQGFIWLGTQYGLQRFDGQYFTTYLHNPSDSNSIASNAISFLELDNDGKLIIGFYSENIIDSFDPCADNLNGEYTITGSGNNTMGATNDNIAFSSQTICGNGMITAKVENVTPNGYGGLMIRETTDADAKQVAVFSNLSNILRHETRYTTNGFKQVNNFFKPSPIWLRLERQGDWIFAYYSSTGSNFQYVHGVHVPMQSCVEIGLASFTYLPNAQTEAFFTNVNVTGANGSMSTEIDISPVEQELFNQPLSTEQLKLEVYPNPASHETNLVFERPVEATTTIVLLNQLGQAVEQRQLQAGNQSCNWDISLLPNGVYFMKIATKGNNNQVVKFVKTE